MNNVMMRAALACAALIPLPAVADLSYTYIDFRVLATDVSATGAASPAPGQQVAAATQEGNGISVAASVELPAGFYLLGAFNNSVIDVRNRITSPLTEVVVDDEFDLVTSSIGFGYRRSLTRTLDVIAELTRDAAEMDFGSLAGENFDTKDSGAAAAVGLRWAPTDPLELYAGAAHRPYGEARLNDRAFDAATLVNAGLRWSFFPDLGVGLDYQSGDLSVVTLSMRFSFGDLPW